jgi:hypothetical protein
VAAAAHQPTSTLICHAANGPATLPATSPTTRLAINRRRADIQASVGQRRTVAAMS